MEDAQIIERVRSKGVWHNRYRTVNKKNYIIELFIQQPARKRFFGVLSKILPFVTYNFMVELEAKLRPKEIIDMYFHDMKTEYESLREYLPHNCINILDIGCGIAGINIYKNEYYSPQNSNSGAIYAAGQGIPQNYIKDYSLWIVAGGQGYQNAKQNLSLLELRIVDPQPICFDQILIRKHLFNVIVKRS